MEVKELGDSEQPILMVTKGGCTKHVPHSLSQVTNDNTLGNISDLSPLENGPLEARNNKNENDPSYYPLDESVVIETPVIRCYCKCTNKSYGFCYYGSRRPYYGTHRIT